jgi:hypothetical protein
MNKLLGICIPYRNREYHLKMLIPHLTKFLNKKGIPHKFYIAHQTDDKLFNRGAMKNIAAQHAFNDGCDYVAFHDVDMLPENDDCDYSYSIDFPTHIATKLSKYRYKLNYEQYFGGVVLFTKEQIEKTNGYSNDYWDWGMEDDDLFWRCRYEGLTEDNLFHSYKNVKCFNFNGDNSYAKIKYNKELNDVISKSHTISILCKIEAQPEKYGNWLIGEEKRSFIEFPIFKIDGLWTYSIGVNNSGAICGSIFNTKQQNTYCWIKRPLNEWTWITMSVNQETNEVWFYCNGKLIKNLQNGSLAEESVKFEGNLEKYVNDILIGRGMEDSPSIANYIKGKISQIKIYDKFTEQKNINNILKNDIKENLIFDLNNENIEWSNVEETIEDIDVYGNNTPHRREGRFYSLPHEDEGFVNGKWIKGETTAKNERRFVLEMQKQKINYKEDGIKQLQYELISKEEISENCFMINVKL